MDIFAPSHLLVLLVIILIIFGPSKLGDVGGALGKAIKDFKKAMGEAKTRIAELGPDAQKNAERPVAPPLQPEPANVKTTPAEEPEIPIRTWGGRDHRAKSGRCQQAQDRRFTATCATPRAGRASRIGRGSKR